LNTVVCDTVNSFNWSNMLSGFLQSVYNDFIASIPVYLQLTERGHFHSTPLNSYTFSATMSPLLGTFLELLLQDSFQCNRQIFFGCLQYPKIFRSLRQTLFLETEVIQTQVRGTGWVFHIKNRFLGQKLLDRVCLMIWNISIVENPIVGSKFRPFSTQFHVSTSIFLHNKLG